MASKIKGITIEIGGDTKPLEKALSDVNKTSRNLQSELREVENLLKLDPGNTELIAQKMKLLQEQTANTTEKLKRLENAQEQVNRQFREGKINDEQYRAFNREIEQTRIQLRQLGESANDSVDEIEELGEASEKSEGKLSKLGSMAGNAAKSIGGMAVKGTAAALVGIGTAAAGIGVAAVKSADDAQKALNSLQVQTGATDSEMKSLEEGMMAIYRNNFGENFEDIATSMATIAQQTSMTGKELESATTNALLLRDSFDFDVTDSTRAVNQMMKEFGISADEAYTLIAQGAQNGLNANDDLLDTINEYSVHFKQLGLDAEDMFNMLENGTESGTFSVDKLGDAVKEFGIRVKDGSNTTTDAFEALGLDSDDMTKRFSEGGEEASKAFDDVIKALMDCDDKVVQNTAGVGLFGTMWEDLGVEAIGALTNVNGEISKSSDTLKQMNKIKYNDLGSAISGIGRILQTDFLIPMGKEVLPLLSEFANALSKGFSGDSLSDFTKSINTFSEEIIIKLTAALPHLVKVISEVLSGIASALAEVIPTVLPLLIDGAYQLINALITVIQENTPAFASLAGELITGFITFLMETLPSLADAALQIVITLMNALSESLPTLIPVMVEGILNLVQTILDHLPSFIEAAINIILALVEGILNALPTLLEQAPVIIGQLVEALVAAIPQLIEAAVQIITGLVEFIINNLDKIIQAAIEIVLALVAGLIQAIPYLVEATPKLVNAIINVFTSTNWAQVGLNLVSGIAKGIASGVSSVVSAAKSMAQSVWNSITSTFDMHSPSRLAIKVFKRDFVEKGIGQGILKGIPEVVRDTTQMGQSIISTMSRIPKLDIAPQIQGLASIKTVGCESTTGITNHYADGDIVIQNMNINSKENAQYFAEYLYSLKKSRNRMIGVMT